MPLNGDGDLRVAAVTMDDATVAHHNGEGADLVLGVQWLRALGPVTTDYTALSMSFTHLGLPIKLFADVLVTPPPASAHQLRKMLRTQAVAALF